MARLDGKVAIVTGSANGIGARTAERFVVEGVTAVFGGGQWSALRSGLDGLRAAFDALN